MRRIKITTSGIIAFTGLLVFGFIYLVSNFYQFALDKAQITHQEQQLEMAKAAAHGISYYTEHLAHDLQWLAGQPISANQKMPFINSGEDEAIKAWFITDSNFKITAHWGLALPGWAQDEIKRILIPTAAFCDFTKVYPFVKTEPDSAFYFIALLPMQRPAGSGGQTQYLGALISFDWLMQRFISPLKLAEDDFAWVMDGAGRLIYHPNHKEMLLRSTKDLRKDCVECHKSFTFQDSMFASGHSTGKYFIEGEAPKIMAYAPINLNNQHWVVAISTYLPSVVQGVTNTLLPIWILSGIFLVLLILVGLALYYLNLKRIRAAEGQKHFQQVQRIQEKLDQAAKLASIGELVDSVAHEINTPTGIIATMTDSIILQNCANPGCTTDLEVIKNQVRRISNYTKSLLAYSRRMPFQSQSNDIMELVEECLFLVSPRLRANRVKVVRDMPKEFPTFTFDRPRLEQVIINLLNNAIDFVSDPGKITVKLELGPAPPGGETDQQVSLTVADNGKGIPAADLPNVFEPFYSTKPLSKGTGLGLSISKSIIDRHNGQIKIKTVPDAGTSFIICLPFTGTAT